MAFNTGTGTKLAIGKESAWGSAHADTMLINYMSESIEPKLKRLEEESLLATKAAAAFDLTAFNAEGDFTCVLKPENAGFFVEAALGGTDTVTNPSATYCHTIIAQVAGTVIPSYTIYVDRKQAIKKYSGMKVDNFKLSGKAGDYCRVTISWKGKDEATGTIATSTVPSLKAYKFIGATLTVGGTSYEFQSADFMINNNLDGGIQTSASGVYYTEPLHQKREIKVHVEMPYETNAETLWTTNWLAETLSGTVILHYESPSIITAALKYRMDITLNNTAVTSFTRPVTGAGLIGASIDLTATSVGATEPVSIAVYDATSGAYSA
jgi:hypothetical protein